MSKKTLSESDICAKYITPVVIQAGWNDALQIRREVFFTKGRIIVRGKLVTRGKAKPSGLLHSLLPALSDCLDRGQGEQLRRGPRDAAGAGLYRHASTAGKIWAGMTLSGECLMASCLSCVGF